MGGQRSSTDEFAAAHGSERHTIEEDGMGRIRARMSMSLDGFVAGPEQSLENPLGIGGESLHEWAFRTRTFREMQGASTEGADTGLDDERAGAWNENVGATIMGRNMFGPVRGPWGDSDWRGWWGDDPPYHCPVLVLTHYERPSVELDGGTTFHFVTGGVDEAMARAREIAGDGLAQLSGGPGTAREFLRRGLVDELLVSIAPVLLGAGERLFGDLIPDAAAYAVQHLASSPGAAHFTLARPA